LVNLSKSEFAGANRWTGETGSAISNQAATPPAAQPLHALSTTGSRRDARPPPHKGPKPTAPLLRAPSGWVGQSDRRATAAASRQLDAFAAIAA